MDELIQFIQENPIPFLLYFLLLYFLARGFSTPKEESEDKMPGPQDVDALRHYAPFFGKYEGKNKDIQGDTCVTNAELVKEPASRKYDPFFFRGKLCRKNGKAGKRQRKVIKANMKTMNEKKRQTI